MKPLINLSTGLTLGVALNTVMMVALDQKMLIGPFMAGTVALLGLTCAIWYVDHRLRRSLIQLVDELLARSEVGQKRERLQKLRIEIEKGLSLALSAKALGAFSQEMGIETSLESPHV